jgi:hypothetical protein
VLAFGKPRQLHGRDKAVTDTKGVDFHRPVSVAFGPPVAIHLSDHSLFQLIVSTRLHNHVTPPQGYPGFANAIEITNGVTEQLPLSQRAFDQPEPVLDASCFSDGDHMTPCLCDLIGQRKLQRPRAGEQEIFSGQNALCFYKILRPPCREDARQRPSGERNGSVIGACRDNDFPVANTGRNLPTIECELVPRGQGPDRGVVQEFDTIPNCIELGQKLPTPRIIMTQHAGTCHLEPVMKLPEDLPTRLGVLIQYGHVHSRAGGLSRCCHSAWARSEDDQFQFLQLIFPATRIEISPGILESPRFDRPWCSALR